MNVWYLAGPMTGIPKFNYPAFLAAASALRNQGFKIISPAELDEMDSSVDAALALDSIDGDLINAGIKATWGDYLSRDVKIVADQVTGVIFLDGWEKSKGSRLEAFVGVLAGHNFATYIRGGNIQGMSSQLVLAKLMRHTSEGLQNV